MKYLQNQARQGEVDEKYQFWLIGFSGKSIGVGPR
jgi:hypothetical protein